MALLASKLCPTAPTPRCVLALQPRPGQRSSIATPAQSQAGFPDDARQSTPAPTPRRNDDTGRQAQSRGSVAAQSQAGGQSGPTRTEMADMFKRMNSVRAAEGKPAYKTFSLNTVVDFLTGRTMPDGTVWEQVPKDKQQLLADCAAVLAAIKVPPVSAASQVKRGTQYAQEVRREQVAWLVQAVRQLQDPGTSRLPQGSWPIITDAFNEHFNLTKTQKAVKLMYEEYRDTIRTPSVDEGRLLSEQLAWLVREVQQRIEATGSMPPGGWSEVREELAERFGVERPVKSLQQIYYQARNAAQRPDEPAPGDVKRIVEGVNRVRSAEGRAQFKSLTHDALKQFLTGRRMPDGSMWREGYKNKNELLFDCAAILGIQLYPADTATSSGQDDANDSASFDSTQDLKSAQLAFLDNEVRLRTDHTTGRLKQGSWNAIADAYNRQFSETKKPGTLKVYYFENKNTIRSPSPPSDEPLTAQQLAWLLQETEQRMGLQGVMPQGGWNEISEEMLCVYKVHKTPKQLRQAYYRLRPIS